MRAAKYSRAAINRAAVDRDGLCNAVNITVIRYVIGMIFIMLNAFIAILTESFKAEMRRASFGVTLAEVPAGLSLAILARLLLRFPLTRVVCSILECSGAPEGTLEVPGFRTPLSGIPAYGNSHRAFGDWPGTL
jgi:hypothetical protein